MYLSKFAVNTARRQARFLLGSPQAMHAAVMSAFPPDAAMSGSAGSGAGAAPGRVLWRLDRDKPSCDLYVLSPWEPDFTHLVEQAGWATATWQTRDYTSLLDRLKAGQTWNFRLQANPVKQARGNGARGKRLPHVTPEQQSQWLIDRSERHGFAIEPHDDGATQLVVSSRSRSVFGRKDPHNPTAKTPVTLARAQFDGVLRVIDEGQFRDTLVQGIGRAKAYGCGLMTIVNRGNGG